MRRRQHKQFWRINESIRAAQLRVIGSDGKQIGILARNEALTKARQAESDLVEIAPHANPPVAKIIEFAKFKYEQEKKEREERKHEKKGTMLKEVWFTPLIAQGDYETRFGRLREFLKEGAKVRVTIKSKRRLDNTLPHYRLLKRIIADLDDSARVEQEPRMFGRQLVTLLSPLKGQKTHEESTTKIEVKEISAAPVQSDGDGESSPSQELPGPSESK